jgi:YgiT-type zinc finger domain-containing protein
MNAVINEFLLEDDMHKKAVRCSCGEHANLRLVNKIGRFHETLVTVVNVPEYFCSDCGESFMSGSDSLHFAAQVKKAASTESKSILFNENRLYS